MLRASVLPEACLRCTRPMKTTLTSAILHELHAKLRDLATAGRSSTIDLRRLPLTPSERDRLKGVLGNGELAIKLNALGESRILETGFSGGLVGHAYERRWREGRRVPGGLAGSGTRRRNEFGGRRRGQISI